MSISTICILGYFFFHKYAWVEKSRRRYVTNEAGSRNRKKPLKCGVIGTKITKRDK